METLNDDDLDWLTKVENRLIRMRKREAANTKSTLMDDRLMEAIRSVDELRDLIAGRLGRTIETVNEQ